MKKKLIHDEKDMVELVVEEAFVSFSGTKPEPEYACFDGQECFRQCICEGCALNPMTP
jgi:hypothetical protein